MIQAKDITTVILAGGQSSRMGMDKGMILWQNKPLIQHIIDAVQPISNDILIAAKDPAYMQFGHKMISDKIEEQGPLEGLTNTMQKCSTPHLLVLSCDIPLITTEHLKNLIKEPLRSKLRLFSIGGVLQPLTALYHHTSFSHIISKYTSGERSVKRAIEALETEVVVVEESDKHYFSNLNRPEDLDLLNE